MSVELTSVKPLPPVVNKRPGYAQDVHRDPRVHKNSSDGVVIKEAGSSHDTMNDKDTPQTEIPTFDYQLGAGNTDKARRLECPLSLMTDSYKATHLKMFEDSEEMRAYGSFRKAFPNMNDDDRIVVYGIKYYIRNFILRAISDQDIEASRKFLAGHLLSPNISRSPDELNSIKGYFEKDQKNYLDLIGDNKHRFPVKIWAMPEGSVIRPHIPAFIIQAEGKYSRFCTFLETILTMIWYPSCVATLSRYTKDLIEDAFLTSVDGEDDPKYKTLLNSRLHDFGFRGCTCVEQSVIGGSAHLLSFEGSDTMSACYYTQNVLNGGKPTGFSIPATEHSVMTSWKTEIEAMENLCNQFPGGLVSCVMDAFDYEQALSVGLFRIKKSVIDNKCTFVIRPDSGDPVEQVKKALIWGEKVFGSDPNSKGYKVLNNCAVMQGDGITYETVRDILDMVLDLKYSAVNVAFGMGGGLLQKVNRDTMSFATKLNYVMKKKKKW